MGTGVALPNPQTHEYLGGLALDTVSIACVGIGYWGKNLVRNFYDLPGCRLSVCCDLDTDLLHTAAGRYPGVAVTEDYERLLEDPSVDGVVLASPAKDHYEMARMALEAGKHTYVEKPLTLLTQDAEELCRLSESRELVLMVGHLMEYHPAIGALKQYVSDGALGDIHYL